jgi:glutaredoxin-related protein
MLFIDDEFVGGCDKVFEMNETGELDSVLAC